MVTKNKTVKRQRGRPAGNFRDAPYFPEKAKIIVRMRDNGASYTEIATVVGGSRMGCCSTYHRWREWARAVNGAQ